MKQTLAAAGLSLLVSLVPVGFISQTALAVSLPLELNDQVSAAKNTVDNTVHATVNNGKDETARAAHQVTNNGNHGNGNNGNDNNEAQAPVDLSAPIAENRLTANKLRACERRQDQIISNISAISDRGSRQLEVFHSIAERVKAFYAAKNYHVDTYDAVAAETDALYDQSLVSVNTTQSSGESWSCNGMNPTEQFSRFKSAKQAEMQTLAAYKAKVHELLLLVKTAAASSATTSGGME